MTNALSIFADKQFSKGNKKSANKLRNSNANSLSLNKSDGKLDFNLKSLILVQNWTGEADLDKGKVTSLVNLNKGKEFSR